MIYQGINMKSIICLLITGLLASVNVSFAAKAMDVEAIVYYLGQSLRVLKPDAAMALKIGNFPSIYDMIQKTLSMDIPIYVCEASKQMLGWDKVELVPGLKIVGAATLNDLVLDAKGTMWF